MATWSDLRSGRTIFQDRVDRRSTVKKVVVQLCLNALPLFTHPKGGPGVGWFFALLGFPVFLGLVHEGSCQGLLLRIDRSFEREMVLRSFGMIISFTCMIVALNVDGCFSFCF